jgi:hypothetical protein
MGRHTPEYVYGTKPETETTLTKLKKLLHLPVRKNEERDPSYGVNDDDVTTQWLRDIHESPLPDYGPYAGLYENWEYCVSRHGTVVIHGTYALTPSEPGREDAVATAILADWFDYNAIDYAARKNYEICVRRPGAPTWQGFAEGRE